MNWPCTVTGWRIYNAGIRGLYSPFQVGYTAPVRTFEDAACAHGCPVIPGPGCQCGWFASDRLADLRAMVIGLQAAADGVVGRFMREFRQIHGLALAGVELRDAIPAPVSAAARAELRQFNADTGIRLVAETDNTWRGRTITITGPVIVTAAEVVTPLTDLYGVTVHHSPDSMLAIIGRLMKAGRIHGHKPADLAPHLSTELLGH